MIGKSLLHYKVVEKIGEGGMGVVYLAEDTKLERQVAIKFLPHSLSDHTDERKRFEVEARAAAALNHPNISTIHNIEESDGELFLVMEYIKGLELKEKIKKERLTVENSVEIAIQIAKGLQAAHEQKIVHRDIKSSNIMVTEKGIVKIMDFGLARFQGSVHLTQVGSTIGTVAYMSPEHVRGEEVDHRSDIWSYGIVLFEMLTGKLPFFGDYEQAVLYSILNEDTNSVSEFGDEQVPPGLESIIKKCLQKDPINRYQTIDEVLKDLASGVVEKRKISTDTEKKGKKRYASIIISVLIIIVIAVIYTKKNQFFNFGDEDKVQHLAVLPFETISKDSSTIAFSNGLIEIVTSKLTQLEKFHGNLWVVPSSEIRKNKVVSPSEAYKLFGANLAVNGSVQIVNDNVRLSINLIDAKNLRQLTSKIIDVKVNELFSLQDKSVKTLLQLLDRKINPASEEILTAGVTTIPGAYELYLQGMGYMKRFDDKANLTMAISLFQQAVKNDSSYALAYAGLAEAYWLMFDASKEKKWVSLSDKVLQQALVLNDDLAEVSISAGIVYSGTGRNDDAINSFENALNIDPKNASALRGLAKSYEVNNQFEEAEEIYKTAIKLKTDYWGGYNALGVFYFKNGQYENAIKQFKQIILLTPDNSKGYNNLGGVYYMLKRWPEAEEIFKQSLDLKKTYRVCSNLGTLYYIKGKYDDAAHMYNMALELNNSDYRVWGNLASAYYWSDNNREKAFDIYQQAISMAEEIVEVNPTNADAIVSLAGFHAMLHHDRKALELIDKAIRYAPNDGNVLFRVGSAFEQLGSREKAIDWLIKAIENGYSRDEIENQPELAKLISDEQYRKKINRLGSSQ